MIKLLLEPKIFSYIIMILYLLNAGRWAIDGKWADVIYWVAAFFLTAAFTWGFEH